jgi:hypothetical protein
MRVKLTITVPTRDESGGVWAPESATDPIFMRFAAYHQFVEKIEPNWGASFARRGLDVADYSMWMSPAAHLMVWKRRKLRGLTPAADETEQFLIYQYDTDSMLRGQVLYHRYTQAQLRVEALTEDTYELNDSFLDEFSDPDYIHEPKQLRKIGSYMTAKGRKRFADSLATHWKRDAFLEIYGIS